MPRASVVPLAEKCGVPPRHVGPEAAFPDDDEIFLPLSAGNAVRIFGIPRGVRGQAAVDPRVRAVDLLVAQADPRASAAGGRETGNELLLLLRFNDRKV